MSRDEAAALAALLELDVDDIAMCHACLSFVSLAIDSGDERKVAGSITSMAPDLWAEGLAQPVRLALERARKRGVANAEEAIVAGRQVGLSQSGSSRDRPQAGRRPLGSGAGRPLPDGLATLAA